MGFLLGLLPLLNGLFGNIITPFVNAWVSYKTTALKSGEAGFEVAATQDTIVMTAALQADVQMAQVKASLYGMPVVRFVMWAVAGCFVTHFVLITIDTILAAKCFYGHPVLGIPPFPDLKNESENIVLYGFFALQTVHLGTSNVKQWLGRKQ